jgi:hypothetical protein
MSVEYYFFRVTSFDNAETAFADPQPFGSRADIIDRLSSTIGFQLESVDDFDSPDSAVVSYQYHHEDDEGKWLEFSLDGDPVTFISLHRNQPEDFYPIIDVLKDLAPFAIAENGDIMLDPDRFEYTYDDWIQLNYEDSEL